jgi:hypothetical protein
MSSFLKSDVSAVTVLAFDFLVSGPAEQYPLWTVHNT